MTRSLQISVAVCAALVFVAVAYVWQMSSSKPVAPSINDALQVSESGMPTRLYSGSVDAKSGQPVEVNDQSYDLVTGGRKVASFLVRKDRTTRDTFYQNDGEGLAFVREYYPLLPDDIGRRIKGLVTYTGDGKTMRSEIWWSFDGTRQRIGHLLDVSSGRYEEMVLFPDGNSAQSSKITEPNIYANNFERKLIIEKRWSDNAGHALIYFDELADDGTREIVTYDDNENPVMAKHIGRWGKVGTTVKFYFPASTKVRLESETTVDQTLVTSYRLDGSVLYKQQLLSYQQSTTYFDSTGKNPLYEQIRWTNNVESGGAAGMSLWKINEVEAGKLKRELVWSGAKFSTETIYDVTVDGVNYEKVVRAYREDGTLKHVDMIGRGVPTRSVDYTTADNIRVQIPQAEMAVQEHHDEIPIPEPQTNINDH